MKNKRVVPTIFSLDKKEFKKRFEKIVKIADKIQIDFMDGKFVPAKSLSLNDIPNLKKYKKIFEAHLMVLHPEKWFKGCKTKGFKRVIFHVESVEDPFKIISLAKKIGLEVYIAINPSTSLKKINPIIKRNLADGILLLGVQPGKENQKLSFNIPRRIKKIKKMNGKIIVEVDGGINDKTIKKVAKAGVDKVNSGSFVSKSKNPKKQIEILEKIFRQV